MPITGEVIPTPAVAQLLGNSPAHIRLLRHTAASLHHCTQTKMNQRPPDRFECNLKLIQAHVTMQDRRHLGTLQYADCSTAVLILA